MYIIKEDKIIGVLDAEKGEIIRDAEYKPLSAEDFVKQKAQSYFEIMQGDPGRSGTGNTTQAASGAGSLNVYRGTGKVLLAPVGNQAMKPQQVIEKEPVIVGDDDE